MGQLTQSAVGREAVTITGNGSGQSVTFTSPVATNSIDLRQDPGHVRRVRLHTAPLSLYINGVKQSDLTLTNKYEQVLRQPPVQQHAGQSATPMHAFDEVHRLFSTTYQAGQAGDPAAG